MAAENAKNTKDDSLETITKHLHVSTRSTQLKNYTPYASFAAKIAVGFVAAENAKSTKDDCSETISKYLHVSTRSTRLKELHALCVLCG